MSRPPKQRDLPSDKALRYVQFGVELLLILGFIALISLARSDDDDAAGRDRAADAAHRAAPEQKHDK
ncbi:hypothetical protein [Rugamonas sp.]|uniref:hypothetical protein n=1 Tax=Rugamonas sp. TaxID=1926287 RepID=UPI0025DB50DF|nr:hypothetical protein [Rugamonas sp.]